MAELNTFQQALANLMSDISEDAYCAGWMMGLEFDLWRLLHSNPPRPYGMINISDNSMKMLKELSDHVGGWIVVSNDQDHDYDFVPLHEWEQMFREHEAKRAVRFNT